MGLDRLALSARQTTQSLLRRRTSCILVGRPRRWKQLLEAKMLRPKCISSNGLGSLARASVSASLWSLRSPLSRWTMEERALRFCQKAGLSFRDRANTYCVRQRTRLLISVDVGPVCAPIRFTSSRSIAPMALSQYSISSQSLSLISISSSSSSSISASLSSRCLLTPCGLAAFSSFAAGGASPSTF